MLTYVRYLVDSGRWADLKPRLAEIGDDGNSHSPHLATYERMLAEFRPVYDQILRGARGHSREAYLLTADDLRQIAEAWVHPSNR